MNGFTINILLNHSIIIAALLGMIRFKSIASDFHPFLWLIWIGVVNETLSLVFIYSFGSNAVNSNIYVLIEYGLVLFQFYRWNREYLKVCRLLAIVGLLIWILDDCLLNNISENNSVFRIFYSVVIVLLSVMEVNRIIINERKMIMGNAIFIICVTFLVYYGCKAFVEVFNAFQMELSKQFNRSMFRILYAANLFSNIMYAISILCMPRKQEFTMPY